MGRKPLPKNLKMLRGTYRADRDNPDAPEPPPVRDVPKPPTTLNAAGRKKWKELAPMLQEIGVLTESDLPAFEALCVHYGLMCEAAKALKKEGLLVQGDRGMVKNPAAQLHRDNSTAFRQYCGLFGLTPADRPRVNAAKSPEQNNEFAYFAEARKQKAGGAVSAAAYIVPAPPARLSVEAKRFWREHAPACAAMGSLGAENQTLFAGLCITWGRIRDMEERIAAEGHVIEGPDGPEVHPLMEDRGAALDLFLTLSSDFGLSPMGRKRQGLTLPDDFGDVLRRGLPPGWSPN